MSWLETQAKDLLGESSRLDLYVIADAMKDPLFDPEAFIEASRVVDDLQLHFSCPFCRSVMRKRPIPAIVVEDVIRRLGMDKNGEEEAIVEELLCQVNDSFEQYLLF